MHANACSVETPSGRFFAPRTFSIHGREVSSPPTLIDVGKVRRSANDSGHRLKHALSRASSAGTKFWGVTKSSKRARQLVETKLPSSGPVPVQAPSATSVVVTAIR